MLTCMNHHVALVRLRVPLAYVDFLADPTCSATAGGDPAVTARARVPPEGLRLDRSRWWDLLVAEDRVEAARAICGALAWLMRGSEEGGTGEGDRMEVEEAEDSGGA